MQNLFDQISTLTAVNEQSRKKIAEILQLLKLKKGALLVREGEVCRHMYFLTRGSARGFFYQHGKDITSWFALDNDIATPMDSFISQRPSYENVEMLEDSELYAVGYEQLQQLYIQFPEFERVGRILTEKYYVDLMNRTMSFQFQTATERYHDLLKKQPSLFQKAALGHIASYLGISQETLSRIRTKV